MITKTLKINQTNYGGRGRGTTPSGPCPGPGPIDVVPAHHGLLRVAEVVRQVPIEGSRDILVPPPHRTPKEREVAPARPACSL